jgi:hypothetical protein
MSRGYRFLAELVGILNRQPRTLLELYDLLPGISLIPLQRVVSELATGSVLRVCDWRKTQKHGKPSRVFGVGDEPNAPPPPRADGSKSHAPAEPIRPKRKAQRTMVNRFCALWHALEEPKSARQAAQACGIAEHDCRFALHAMRRNRLIRVAMLVRENRAGKPTAYWVRGSEAVAIEPLVVAPLPRASVVARAA